MGCYNKIRRIVHFLPNDYISEQISKGYEWEPHLKNIFTKFVDKSSTVIEAGAHIGVHTLTLSKLAKSVLAFEPFVDTFHVLQKNTRDYNNITVFNLGLSDQQEDSGFEWIDENNVAVAGLINNPLTDYSIKKSPYKHVVKNTTIDLLNKKVDFIKIDVEGYETKVIKGALNTIKKHTPVIVLECWKNRHGEFDTNYTKNQFQFLLDIGYTVKHILGPDFLFIPKNKLNFL